MAEKMLLKNKLLAMAFMLVATITMALTNPVSAKAESLEAEFTKEKKFEYYESGGSAVSETDIETAVIEAYNVDKENKYIFYIKNAHGDIIGKVNEQGNLLSSYAYNAFGEVVTFVDFTLEQQQSINRFLYAGEQYDETSGLYYLRARNYDAGAGRFTQEDTYLGDGRNLYAYVHCNPLKYVDPSGHASEEQFDNDGDTNDWLDKATEGGGYFGVGNPVPIVGLGNTGRIIPNTLTEQMAMHQVRSNPLNGATTVPVVMNDSRWSASAGWVKKQSVINSSSGKTIVHFNYNENNGLFDDFKFK